MVGPEETMMDVPACLPAPLAAIARRAAEASDPRAQVMELITCLEHTVMLAAACLSGWCRARGERVLPASVQRISFGTRARWAKEGIERVRKGTSEAERRVVEAMTRPWGGRFERAANDLGVVLKEMGKEGWTSKEWSGLTFLDAVVEVRNGVFHLDPGAYADRLAPLIWVILGRFVEALASVWAHGLVHVERALERDELIELRGVDLVTGQTIDLEAGTVRGRPIARGDLVAVIVPAQPQEGARALVVSLRPWITTRRLGDGVGVTLCRLDDVAKRGASYLGADGRHHRDKGLADEVRGFADDGLTIRTRLTAGLRSSSDLLVRVGRFLDAYMGPDEAQPFNGCDDDVDVPRAFVTDEVGPTNLLITAPLGRGKSAAMVKLATELARRNDLAVIFAPLSLRFDSCDESSLLALLVGRLRDLHQIKPYEGPSPADEVRRLLDRQLPDDRTLVLILDGADEARFDLRALGILPPTAEHGRRTIVTARSRPDDPRGVAQARALGWDSPGAFRHARLRDFRVDDLAEVLRRQPEPLDSLAEDPRVVSTVHAASEGSPLVLWLLFAELSAMPLASDGDRTELIAELKGRASGLRGYFSRFWEEQRKLLGEDPMATDEARAVLAVLACSEVALGREEIAGIVGDAGRRGQTLKGVITRLGRLVHGDADSGYFMSHPGLAIHVREQELDAEERRTWERNIDTYVQRVVEEVGAGVRFPAAVPRSVVRIARTVFERRRADTKAWLVLCSKAWHDARNQFGADLAGFRGDVHAAWSAIEKNGGLDIAADVGCAMALACASTVGDLQRDLVELLLEHGLWTFEDALAWASTGAISVNPSDRQNLEWLVPKLPERLHGALIPVLTEMVQDRRAWIEPIVREMMKVSSMSVIVLREAVQFVANHDLRARLLAEIAVNRSDAGALVEEALELLQSEPSAPYARMKALIGIAATRPNRASAEMDLRQAFGMARRVRDEQGAGAGALVLCELLPSTSGSLRGDVLMDIEVLVPALDAYTGVDVAKRVLGHGDGATHDRATQWLEGAIRRGESLQQRVSLWCRDGALLPEHERRAIGRELIAEIAGHAAEGEQYELLRHLLESGYEACVILGLIEDVVPLARGLTTPWRRRDALGRVARLLDEGERLELANAALDDANGLHSWHALCPVLVTLSRDVCLTLARRAAPTSPTNRLNLLQCAMALSEGGGNALITEALTRAQEIETADIRALALLDLASKTNGSRSVVEAMSDAIDAIDDPLKAIDVRVKVIERLVPAHRRRLIDEVMHRIEALQDPTHAMHLERLATLAAPNARLSLVQDRLLPLVRRLPHALHRRSVMLSLARLKDLTPGLRRALVSECLDDHRERIALGRAVVALAPLSRDVSEEQAHELVLLVERAPVPLDRWNACFALASFDARVSELLFQVARSTLYDVPLDRLNGLLPERIAELCNFPGLVQTRARRTELVDLVLDAAEEGLDRTRPLPATIGQEDPLAYSREDPRHTAEMSGGNAVLSVVVHMSATQKERATALARRFTGGNRTAMLAALHLPADQDPRRSRIDASIREIERWIPQDRGSGVHAYDPVRILASLQDEDRPEVRDFLVSRLGDLPPETAQGVRFHVQPFFDAQPDPKELVERLERVATSDPSGLGRTVERYIQRARLRDADLTSMKRCLLNAMEGSRRSPDDERAAALAFIEAELLRRRAIAPRAACETARRLLRADVTSIARVLETIRALAPLMKALGPEVVGNLVATSVRATREWGWEERTATR